MAGTSAASPGDAGRQGPRYWPVYDEARSKSRSVYLISVRLLLGCSLMDVDAIRVVMGCYGWRWQRALGWRYDVPDACSGWWKRDPGQNGDVVSRICRWNREVLLVALGIRG